MGSRVLLFLSLTASITVVSLTWADDTQPTPESVTLADSVGDCFDCILGIFDDEAMTRNTGTLDSALVKDIYLGIHFGEGYNDLAGIEFSIAGLDFEETGIIVLSVDGVTPIHDVSWYLPQAPADTSAASTGQGGMFILWKPSLYGDQALVRIRILSFDPPTDHVLQVKRMYPTSNPWQWHTPILVQNRSPLFPVARISGDCYILNWSGDLGVSCDVITGIEATTWSAMKRLYR